MRLPGVINSLGLFAPEQIEEKRLPPKTIRELVKQRSNECLQDNDNNITHSAKELGVSVRTLQRWVKNNFCQVYINNKE